MTDEPISLSPETEARQFYNGALRRAQQFAAVLGAVLAVCCFSLRGIRFGVPFLAGVLVGWLNFLWLARSCTQLMDRVASLSQQGTPSARIPKGGGAVLRFLLRYVLIGVVSYVIFKSTAFDVLGFFAGLSISIAALMVEAMFEVFMALRRGF